MVEPYRQRKFSVFLSMTTSGSLKHVRERLASHTVACGHIPVAMELWPSSSQPVRDVIHAWLHNCDIFVQVLGKEYGTISQEEGVSFTELEFNEAAELGKPILTFILKDEEFDEARDAVLAESRRAAGSANAASAAALTEAQDQFDKFEAFRKRARNPSSRYPRYFSLKAPSQLDVDYLHALQETAASMQEGGWVRESEVQDALQLNEAVRSNVFFERYVERLKAFPILSQRTGDGQDEKEAIAEYFWDRYLSKLATWKMDRLFFESGSTLAYAGYEFGQRLRKPWVRTYFDGRRKENDEIEILTNNILIYLDFALAEFDSDPMRIKRYPVGPADPYYGAMFGDLTSLIDLPAEYGNGELSDEAKGKVGRMSEELAGKLGERGLILMAASGLETDRDSSFYGPHVGSYYNMLIKRALMMTSQPKVLFLHSAKIEQGSFHRGKCFAVCDKTTGTWKEMTKNKPLAIATSAKSETSARKILKHLQDCGLRNIESNWPDLEDPSRKSEPPDIVTIVACNDRFKMLFPSTTDEAPAAPRPRRRR